MNQSILFPDIQDWDDALNGVKFPAQQTGALIECVASLEYLSSLASEPLTTTQQALAVFEQNRFEIEELAEQLIEEEEYNAEGLVEFRA